MCGDRAAPIATRKAWLRGCVGGERGDPGSVGMLRGCKRMIYWRVVLVMNATGIWRECMKSNSETAFDFHRDMYGLGCGEDAEKSFEE
jgi:hypothetical protein